MRTLNWIPLKNNKPLLLKAFTATQNSKMFSTSGQRSSFSNPFDTFDWFKTILKYEILTLHCEDIQIRILKFVSSFQLPIVLFVLVKVCLLLKKLERLNRSGQTISFDLTWPELDKCYKRSEFKNVAFKNELIFSAKS